MQDIPIVPLDAFLRRPGSSLTRVHIREIVDILSRLGLILVRDPRIRKNIHDDYLAMMGRFFREDDAFKRHYARPTLHHQTGWTPPFQELARDHRSAFANASAKDQPVWFEGRDPKERWFTPTPDGDRMNDSTSASDAVPLIPEGYPEWVDVSRGWYVQTKNTISTFLQMLALGLGLDESAFLDLIRHGPHLLSSTGTDLNKYGTHGTGVARVHYDFNLVTAHAHGTCPGFRAWKRDLHRFPVKIPPGCILMQAGRELHYLTAGAIHYGLHEVVTSAEAQPFMDQERAEGRVPWRVSCNFFCHMATNTILQPLGRFATPEALRNFPPIPTSDYITAELAEIGLAQT